MSAEMPTYHASDFRTFPPAIVKDRDGRLVIMTLCEELDPESGRWEPFYSTGPVKRSE
jgi:hypothetical protein